MQSRSCLYTNGNTSKRSGHGTIKMTNERFALDYAHLFGFFGYWVGCGLYCSLEAFGRLGCAHVLAL